MCNATDKHYGSWVRYLLSFRYGSWGSPYTVPVLCSWLGGGGGVVEGVSVECFPS
jgi:hypothetical protein